jgi:lipid-A-disaccharide synthase-like uncharacterized protein
MKPLIVSAILVSAFLGSGARLWGASQPETSAAGAVIAGLEKTSQPSLVRNDDGSFSYLLPRREGGPEVLTPEEFAERSFYGAGLTPASSSPDRLYKVLNITSAAGIGWVVLGLFGQLLYTARMGLQWIASERRKQSVIPVAFWWLSLAAAGSLIGYFIWRRDIVGILGNAIGGFVYIRNLCLIAAAKRRGAGS